MGFHYSHLDFPGHQKGDGEDCKRYLFLKEYELYRLSLQDHYSCTLFTWKNLTQFTSYYHWTLKFKYSASQYHH